jgi:hypothetical protein
LLTEQIYIPKNAIHFIPKLMKSLPGWPPNQSSPVNPKAGIRKYILFFFPKHGLTTSQFNPRTDLRPIHGFLDFDTIITTDVRPNIRRLHIRNPDGQSDRLQ